MEFKNLKHSYENTGGSIMAGFDTIWLPEAKKTIFTITNDEGCSFWSVDAYHFGLTEEEPFAAIDFSRDEPNCWLGDIAKDCLERFLLDDDHRSSVDWDWMPDSVKSQVTEHYKAWHQENFFVEEYVVRKGKIVHEDIYEAPPDRQAQACYYMMYADLISHLHNFQEAYLGILKLSDQLKCASCLCNEYPFSKSFRELKIPDWVSQSVNDIMINKIIEPLTEEEN